MDIKVLKDITKLMRDNDLIEVEVESDNLKIKLRKASAAPMTVQALAAPAPPIAAAAPAAVPVAPAKPADDANWRPITSPIPGTVYLKPNPDAAQFVNEGAAVDAGKVVCLIEAMKVFNEIKPEPGITGQIKRICVKDGQPVEYGTVLFLVG